VSLVACAAIVASSFLRMDVPTALYFWNVGHLRSPLNVAFGSLLFARPALSLAVNPYIQV
jgi:hypothetical protein